VTLARNLASLLAMTCVAAATAAGAALTPESAAELTRRLDAYVAVHRRAEAAVPPRRTSDDPARVVERRKALAAAIRAERRDARQGAIFAPEIEAEYRRLIRADLRARTPKDRAAVREEVPRLPFAVNDGYPERAPHATVPAMLLASLPRLPQELEYRFFDRHLLLLDVDANLIVDYIPNALPPAAR
jgi:hypothetical protein